MCLNLLNNVIEEQTHVKWMKMKEK